MFKAFGGLAIIWLLSFLMVFEVSAAGFNCAPYLRSGKCPEVAICRDSYLSSQDSLMNKLYRELKGKLRGRERAALKQDQRDFIRYRADCGCNVECLGEAYRSQNKGLGKTSLTIGNGSSYPTTSGSGYNSGSGGGGCANKPNAAQREICRDPSLAALDVDLNDVYQNLKRALNSSEKRALRRSQLAWLKRRDRCGADFDCINGLYRSRINVLDGGSW